MTKAACLVLVAHFVENDPKKLAPPQSIFIEIEAQDIDKGKYGIMFFHKNAVCVHFNT